MFYGVSIQYSDTIPNFSIVLKVILFLSDRHKIFTVIDYELKFLKMQFLVKSISL